MKKYYEILGLHEYASENEVKAAFRNLSRQCHPDLNGNSKESVDRFNIINEAYTAVKKDIKNKFAIFGIAPTKNPDDLQVAFRKINDQLKQRIAEGDLKAEEEMKELAIRYNHLQSELVGECKVEW
jgi:curved DNA-binding protein CbpA